MVTIKVAFFDLKRQYEALKNEIEAAVIGVLQSSSYIGGKYVGDFEEKMKAYLGVKHVVSCANGTDALVIALKACGISAGDEVITTPFSFFATAEAIASIGAIPVFADVNENDYNIDSSKIEEKISNKTKAILPVHLFGTPCNIDEISMIASKYGLKVIEDAAQAIGSEYKSTKIGATADIGCFSFYPTKNLGAFGDAGMTTTNDDDLAEVLRAFREHGMSSSGLAAREYLFGEKEEAKHLLKSEGVYNPNKYFNYIVGYNSRLDALQAAILSVKLNYLDEYNRKRARIAEMYSKELEGIAKTPPISTDEITNCYHQFVIRTNKKKELIDYLFGIGIETGCFYPVPLHLQKALKYLGYKEGDMPVAEMLSRETVCLPIYPELRDDEVAYVTRHVKAYLGG